MCLLFLNESIYKSIYGSIYISVCLCIYLFIYRNGRSPGIFLETFGEIIISESSNWIKEGSNLAPRAKGPQIWETFLMIPSILCFPRIRNVLPSFSVSHRSAWVSERLHLFPKKNESKLSFKIFRSWWCMMNLRAQKDRYVSPWWFILEDFDKTILSRNFVLGFRRVK